MKKITIFVFLFLCTNYMYSQEESVPTLNNNPIEMNKSNMLGLRTTIYKVGDINKAKVWYAKAFGIEPYFDQPFYVGFNIGGYELGLQPEEKPTTAKAESVVSYWGVDKIQDVYDHFISLGAIENEKPYNVGGEMMTATVKDPFGNVIGLIYNPYFKLKE